MNKLTNSYLLYSVVLVLLPILANLRFDFFQGNNGQNPAPSFTPLSPTGPPEDCTESFVFTRPFDFVPILKCQFEHPGIITYSLPLFADIDGDKETEVVVTLDYSPNGIIIINPHTCEEEYRLNIPGDIDLKDGGPVLGDVDKDGYVDIFITAGTTIQRWEYSESTQRVEQVWSTPAGISLADRPHLDILDLNQDGTPELIPNQGQMVDAATGKVYGGRVPTLNTEGKGLFAFTADAIPGNETNGEGNVELIYGTHIYHYNFITEEWVLIKQVPGLDWGEVANVSVADMDLDGDVDATITQWDETGQALIWDLQTNELLGGGIFDYPGEFGSRMNIANMDDDPYPEMVMTCVFQIFAIDDIVTTRTFGDIIWLDETTDESGHTQLTSFDFDGDGTYEIAYRDETQLRIFSGLGDGIPDGPYPSSPLILLNSGPNSCRSLTGMEYPTIGDIDDDGEAEIIASCEGNISIYESGSMPWGLASQVWNTQAFNLTNVNQDGTIPAKPVENYTLYNNFLAQVNLNPESDTIFRTLPDGIVEIQELSTDCTSKLSFQFQVCNQGARGLPKATPISFYWKDPTQNIDAPFDQVELPRTLQTGECVDFESRLYDVDKKELKNLYIVVNDDGRSPSKPYILDRIEDGGDFPFTRIRECDYTNNMATENVAVGFDQTYNQWVQICEGESYDFFGTNYEVSGRYTQEFISSFGCDSIIALNLEILPPDRTAIFVDICEGDSYFFGGLLIEEAGVYKDTLSSIVTGCDSVTTLVLEMFPASRTTLTSNICEGESFEYRNKIYTEAGVYTEKLVSENGCDSIITLEIETYPPNTSTITVEICDGDSFLYGNQNYSEPGFYEQQYGDTNGCDSIVNLNLVVHPTKLTELSGSICENEVYDFHGRLLNAPGLYADTLQTSFGCDSIVTLDLEVRPLAYKNINAIICNQGTFEYNGVSYTDSGTHEHIFTGKNGCDSIITLNIQKISPDINEVALEICFGDVFFIGEEVYTDPGTYSGVLSAMDGCDSITNYTLVVYDEYYDRKTAEICDGETYFFEGQYLRKPGRYVNELQTVNGCDSIIELNLRVNPISIVYLDSVICEGDLMVYNRDTLTESGEYIEVVNNANGCDSISVLSLEVLAAENIRAEDARICLGDSTQLRAAGGRTTYFWTPAEGLSCTDCPNPIASPNQTTVYKVFSTGCLDRPISAEVTVEVLDFPSLRLGEDFQVKFGDDAYLSPKLDNYNGEAIVWEQDGVVICPDCPDVTITPYQTTTITATIANELGCGNSDEIVIDVRKNCIEEDFFIPNMFTPNDDGVNDEFYIEAFIDAELKWLHIYDRWGERLFSATSFREHWNGTYRDQPLNPGVYVYHLQMECPDGAQFSKVGNVTIIK